MLILNKPEKNLIDASSLCIGFFDGVHKGHQKIIGDCIEKSKSLGTESVVLTFSNHPREFSHGDAPKSLTTIEQRLELFQKLGIEAVLILPFDKKLYEMRANDYIKEILVDCLNPKTITVGYNHHFGKNREGNSRVLADYGSFEVTVIEPVKINGDIVSSSLIRQLLETGNTEKAAKLLGRPFSIRNTVVKGHQIGKALGFPTANLLIPTDISIPQKGVYLGYTNVNNKKYKSLINIGNRPTFNDNKELIEVYLLDFTGNLYDKAIEVEFIKRIRDITKFDNTESLKAQLNLDLESLLNYKGYELL